MKIVVVIKLLIVFSTFSIISCSFGNDYYESYCIDDIIRGNDNIFNLSIYDVAIVKVTKISEGPFSNGNPPIANAEVKTIIQGYNLRKNQKINIYWLPIKNKSDYVEGLDYLNDREKPMKDSWHSKPFNKIPATNQEFIVFLRENVKSEKFEFKISDLLIPGKRKLHDWISRKSIAFTEANLNIVRSHLKLPNRNPQIQTWLFKTIFNLILVSICFGFASILKISKQFLKIAWLTLVASNLTYLIYETGVRNGDPIRIDVLLIISHSIFAFCLLLILSFIFYIKNIKNRRTTLLTLLMDKNHE